MNETIVHVVEALADAEGVEPDDLEYRLQDYVDTEAIERLDGMDGGDWELTFEIADHEVVVDADGTVLVDGERHHTGSEIDGLQQRAVDTRE